MKLARKVGATSQIFQIFIQDSSSATGAGLTGLLFNTASLAAYYHRDTDTTATAITLVTMTVGTFTSSGFKEIDATNMPGWYQFCPPNTALASGAASVGFHLKGATNMAPLPIEVDLDAQVDVTFWNGTVVATPATAGVPDINVKNINNVAAATPGASGGVLISGTNSGTTTLGALTCTGSFTISNGLLVSRSSANTSAITATGNGTGSGFVATSGSGATGDGIQATAASTAGNGFVALGTTTGHGFKTTGGTTGHGVLATGGSTSGDGLRATAATSGKGINAIGIGTTQHGILATGGATTSAGIAATGGATSGDGLLITATTLGHGITTTAVGSSKHGLVSTGGTAGVSDGIKGVAGTGGVDIRGNITGNLTGSVTSVANTVSQSGTAQGGTINTIILASAASSTDGTYDPAIVRITGGTGSGQARMIIDYVGSTRVASVDRDWRTAPDATSTYDILAATNLLSTNEGLAQGGAASTITLNAGASSIDNTYNGQVVVLRTGTGQDQSRIITGYVGATKVATVDAAWATQPTSSTGYMMLQSSRLDATISSRASQTSLDTLDDYVDTEVTAIKAKTDNLPASPAAVGSAMTLTAAYDAAKTAAQASDIPTANITAIKAKTDSLAFTVANQIDANIQFVNGVEVTGDGQSGTEWGP